MPLATQQVGGETVILSKKLEAAIGPHLVVVEGANPGGAALPGGADVNFMGVTLEDGALGEYRPIAVDGGIVRITASAAIARGAEVSIANVAGQIKTSAPGAGINSVVVGIAQDAAAALGDIIGVILTRYSKQG